MYNKGDLIRSGASINFKSTFDKTNFIEKAGNLKNPIMVIDVTDKKIVENAHGIVLILKDLPSTDNEDVIACDFIHNGIWGSNKLFYTYSPGELPIVEADDYFLNNIRKDLTL